MYSLYVYKNDHVLLSIKILFILLLLFSTINATAISIRRINNSNEKDAVEKKISQVVRSDLTQKKEEQKLSLHS